MWASVALAVLAQVAPAPVPSEPPADHPRSELIGLWRGTSVCTDRVAAPACRDEIVVYEFTPGADDKTVRWKADKVVNGKRETMSEFDVVYDRTDSCWKAEFRNTRAHVIWCLVPVGDAMAGSAWLLPGKQRVRKVEARRDPVPGKAVERANVPGRGARAAHRTASCEKNWCRHHAMSPVAAIRPHPHVRRPATVGGIPGAMDAAPSVESEQLEVMATPDTEKKSITVEKIVEVKQK
jgi:hypothetical protein